MSEAPVESGFATSPVARFVAIGLELYREDLGVFNGESLLR